MGTSNDNLGANLIGVAVNKGGAAGVFEITLMDQNYLTLDGDFTDSSILDGRWHHLATSVNPATNL